MNLTALADGFMNSFFQTLKASSSRPTEPWWDVMPWVASRGRHTFGQLCVILKDAGRKRRKTAGEATEELTASTYKHRQELNAYRQTDRERDRQRETQRETERQREKERGRCRHHTHTHTLSQLCSVWGFLLDGEWSTSVNLGAQLGLCVCFVGGWVVCVCVVCVSMCLCSVYLCVYVCTIAAVQSTNRQRWFL